jgi:hypothetical protein
MATKQFNKLTTAFNDREEKGFQIEITLTSGQTSDWYQTPAGTSIIGALVTPVGAGSGKVQITNDTLQRCDLGTAVSEDWPAGSVSATTSDAVYTSVTAVRATCSAGSIRVVFTAQ